jgi:K+-transporting ATPase KdpF subunit
MTVEHIDNVIGLILVVILAGYLLAALLFPDKF